MGASKRKNARVPRIGCALKNPGRLKLIRSPPRHRASESYRGFRIKSPGFYFHFGFALKPRHRRCVLIARSTTVGIHGRKIWINSGGWGERERRARTSEREGMGKGVYEKGHNGSHAREMAAIWCAGPLNHRSFVSRNSFLAAHCNALRSSPLAASSLTSSYITSSPYTRLWANRRSRAPVVCVSHPFVCASFAERLLPVVPVLLLRI